MKNKRKVFFPRTQRRIASSRIKLGVGNLLITNHMLYHWAIENVLTVSNKFKIHVPWCRDYCWVAYRMVHCRVSNIFDFQESEQCIFPFTKYKYYGANKTNNLIDQFWYRIPQKLFCGRKLRAWMNLDAEISICARRPLVVCNRKKVIMFCDFLPNYEVWTENIIYRFSWIWCTQSLS